VRWYRRSIIKTERAGALPVCAFFVHLMKEKQAGLMIAGQTPLVPPPTLEKPATLIPSAALPHRSTK
jgi:hypothetical protein